MYVQLHVMYGAVRKTFQLFLFTLCELYKASEIVFQKVTHIEHKWAPKILIYTAVYWTGYSELTADRLAQLVEYRTTVREVVGSNPGRTNTHGL